MRILRIRPYDPLVLSKTPMTTPDVIGYHDTLPIPPPTTLIGLLGSLLGIRYSSDDNYWGLKILSEEISRVGRCEYPLVRGPLISFIGASNRFFVSVGDYLVSIDNVRRITNIFNEEIYCIDARDSVVRIERLSRVGVKLRRGYESVEKTIEPGYMYRYSLTSYSKGKESLEPIYYYAINCDIDTIEAIARVGGESRLAEIAVVENRDIEKIFDRISSPEHASEGYFIAVTPIPLIPTHRGLSDVCSMLGVEFIDKIIGLPEIVSSDEDLRRIKLGERIPRKRIERVFLGYSEALNKRRPQILSLPQGTIIKTRKIEREANESIKILWRIGFASLLRLS